MRTAELPPVSLVFYEDHEHAKPLSVEVLPWGHVVELFSEHERTNCTPCPGGKKCRAKFSTAFSPGVPRPGTTRLDKNIAFISMLVYDFDHVTRAELEAVCDRIAGLESLLSSTHSHLHGGEDDCCVRVIFPLTRPLKPEEFRHVHREVRRRYALDWIRPGESKPSGADTVTKDLSRLYFLPTAPVGVETIVGHEEGLLLDLEDLLANRTPEPPRAPRASVSSKPVPQAESANMDQLRKCLHAYSPRNPERDEDKVISRKELARRVVAGEPLVKPDEHGLRDDSCHRIGKILANCLPESTPKEAVLELVRASVMAMPTYEGDDPEKDSIEARFNKVAYSFDRGLGEREQQREAMVAKKLENAYLYDEMKRRFKFKEAKKSHEDAAEVAAAAVKLESTSIPVPPPSVPSGGGGGGDGDDGEEGEDDGDGWEEFLLRDPPRQNKDGSESPGKLKNVGFNANVILSLSPDWRGVLRFNEVSKDVVVKGGPLLDYENAPGQLTTGVSYWLQQKFGLFLTKNEVMDAVLHVAKFNSFDPLKDYLNNQRWRGVYRADTFLETYCGALTTDANGHDITQHVRRISRRWLVSAVARGLNPGCKVDTVLILEGSQGVKKSTTIDIMGGRWSSDSAINIADKDSKMLAARSWIVEMPELSALRASETEHQKAFFSSRIDKFRPPYGYAIEEFPRRCVFVGSINDERYMNDITGNRRYWPVRCTDFDIKRLRQDRDQIWAEAVAIYKAGFECPKCLAAEERCEDHRWWLSQEENLVLESINNHRLKNGYSEAIVDHILKIEPKSRPTRYTMHEVATEVLGLAADRIQSQEGQIGRALKVLNFTKERPRIAGVQTVVYVVPPDLLSSPKVERGARRHLQVVPPPRMSAPPATERT